MSDNWKELKPGKTLNADAAAYREPTESELIAENFPPLLNDTFLRAAKGLPTSYTPVWLMRQAGRYLPEYHKPGPDGAAKPDFFTRCQDPALSAQTTLQPLVRFPVDAAIVFSDILIVPQALGRSIDMKPHVGPVFEHPLQVDDELLSSDDPKVHEFLQQMMKSLTVTRHRLGGHVPLIGFTGGPWTLLAYMVEGQPSKTWSIARSWLYKHEKRCHEILKLLTRVIVQYLVDQVKAGAQALQVFESNAGYLTRDLADRFMIPYLCDIASSVKKILAQEQLENVPMIVFPKDATFTVHALEASEFDVVSLDWAVDPLELTSLHSIKPNTLSFQGNLDPCALYGSEQEIRTQVCRMLSSFPQTNGHIANLGHGIYPDAPISAVHTFVDAVHSIDNRPAVRIGTRKSALAMAQARQIWHALTAAHPTRRFVIVSSDSIGDRDTSKPIAQLGVVGAFTKDLEQALLAHSVDLVVHSLKDLSSALNKETLLAAVPARECTGDVLVLSRAMRATLRKSINKQFDTLNVSEKEYEEAIQALMNGIVVGTSSARRAAQLQRRFPNCRVVDVRGNVQTRIRKLESGENGMQALMLAEAGLKRLGLASRADIRFDDHWHAVAQAALGIQIRANDSDTLGLLACAEDQSTRLCVTAERAVARHVGLGCSMPAACCATWNAESSSMILNVAFYSFDGKEELKHTETSQVSTIEEADSFGISVANIMIAQGCKEFLAKLSSTATKGQ